MKTYFLAALLLTACTQEATNPPETVTEEMSTEGAHNSENALDWSGVYRGTLPCADCEGIREEVVLKNDRTYESSKQYMGASEEVLKEKGTFEWSKDGSTIVLNDKSKLKSRQFRVEEGRIRALDKRGEVIEGKQADQYVLSKDDVPLVNTYWKLIELNGIPVKVSEKFRREPHLVLRMDSTLRGHGGCNGYGGNYELKKESGIRFSGVMSTMMACDGVERESEFFGIFENVDKYAVKGDTLTLSKGKMAPSARFVCVYFN